MCMFISRSLSLIAVVPVALLLTVSFFVLLAVRKVEEKGLKAFVYVVTCLLWLAALVVCWVAIYNTGRYPFSRKFLMHEKMKACAAPEMMQHYKMPAMAMPDKGASAKNEKLPRVSKCSGNKGIIFKAE